MKSVMIALLALGLAGFTGCASSNNQPLGGGVTRDQGFRITVPGSPTTVKQGQLETTSINVDRGEFFKQDVKLEVKSTTGITVEPNYLTLKASDKPEVQLRITAAKDAPLGDCRVYVRGWPMNGESTGTDFIVRVVAP